MTYQGLSIFTSADQRTRAKYLHLASRLLQSKRWKGILKNDLHFQQSAAGAGPFLNLNYTQKISPPPSIFFTSEVKDLFLFHSVEMETLL